MINNNKWLDFWNNNKNISFQNRLIYLLLAVNNGDKKAKEFLNIIGDYKNG
jgi:hypothetical protein